MHIYHLAPKFWLQTGPCMPYGLWLRVAAHIILTALSVYERVCDGIAYTRPAIHILLCYRQRYVKNVAV